MYDADFSDAFGTSAIVASALGALSDLYNLVSATVAVDKFLTHDGGCTQGSSLRFRGRTGFVVP
jgi:hypothetical protein